MSWVWVWVSHPVELGLHKAIQQETKHIPTSGLDGHRTEKPTDPLVHTFLLSEGKRGLSWWAPSKKDRTDPERMEGMAPPPEARTTGFWGTPFAWPLKTPCRLTPPSSPLEGFCTFVTDISNSLRSGAVVYRTSTSFSLEKFDQITSWVRQLPTSRPYSIVFETI